MFSIYPIKRQNTYGVPVNPGSVVGTKGSLGGGVTGTVGGVSVGGGGGGVGVVTIPVTGSNGA